MAVTKNLERQELDSTMSKRFIWAVASGGVHSFYPATGWLHPERSVQHSVLQSVVC